MHHARIKAKVRPHQLPGLGSHEVDRVVVRRATTNSDNSLSSSDSGGRCRTGAVKSRDKQVPVTIATDSKQQQQQCSQLFVSVDSTDEVHCSVGQTQLAAVTLRQVYAAEPVPADAEPGEGYSTGNVSVMTMGSLSVPHAHSAASSVRRRSISLVRTSSTFSRSFDDDDAQ